jgi:C1A family cysteine protease
MRKYGFHPDLPDQRDFDFSSTIKKTVKLPTRIDLRENDSPIEDQGELGSCTANAFAGALQFLELKNSRVEISMSRLFIYYNERVIERTVDSDSGASLRDGIKALATAGCCAETIWPYDIEQFCAKPSKTAYAKAIAHTIQAYYRINTLTDMKSCLASGFPFVLGFTVYESFESNEVANTGIVPMPGKNESVLGGHAVMCLGYDDTVQRFIVRNSWGTAWGMSGYFTMPYKYLTSKKLASDMWYISKAKGF